MAEKLKTDNGEENRNDDFSKQLDKTQGAFELIEDLLLSTTKEELEKLGFEENDKVAFVYGDGTTGGRGVEEDKFSVTVTARPRKFSSSEAKSHGYDSGTFEKQTIIGAKRMESQIDFELRNDILHLQYKTTEAAFYRGANVRETGKTFMVRKKLSTPLKDAKTLLKKEFKEAAQQEIGYLTNTKLGVEDRLDASTTSIVENIKMKKLSLKSLFEDELNFGDKKINENEDFNRLPEDDENIEAVKKLNTVDINGKSMLFDDEETNYEDMLAELSQDDDYNSLTPIEQKEINELLNKSNLEEITMSGPAGAGAGAFLTKFFARNSRKFSGGSKKESKIGAPYTISANHPVYQENSMNESKNSPIENTAYFKAKQSRPKVTRDYQIIPETKNSSKPYTQIAIVDPNTHPQGMPFVKPGSQEELEKSMNGDKDKLKRIGINESESDRLERLNKRKFFSNSENEQKGINKRYIVTEKTSEEYEKNRWNKLSLFSKFETIKEAEELNSVFDNIEDYSSFYEAKPNIVSESYENKSNINESSEKTIEVEKPGSLFGIVQKFYEKDFLNESKKYILDLNSKVFVSNPNSK